MDWTDTLKALADPNRLRILTLLENRTLCVCDLEEVLGLNQSNLSRHLAKLKAAGLVTAQKRGLFMHYARKPAPASFAPVLESLYAAVAQEPGFAADRVALNARFGEASCGEGCC
jgi:ArsR family transcriptional regulator